VRDLLFHLPDSFIDRSARSTIVTAVPGQVATLSVEVVSHQPPANARQPWRIIITDGSGFGELVFFSPQRVAACPVGMRLLVSGKVATYDGRLTMPHPDHIGPKPRRGRSRPGAWPMMNCSPTSWRWPGCAAGCGPARVVR
jgi:ATP-dependent DNA helicase RecG